MSDIGLCQCGCGEKTRLAPQNHTKWGWVKGEPLKFCKGHYSPGQGKESPAWKGGKHRSNTGYVYVHQPENPRASKDGYVTEAVLVAEAAIGKYLPSGAEVHHDNGVRDDNRPENLVVCQDQAYHRLLHQRMRALKECGHASWRKCGYCLKYDEPEKLMIYDHGGARHQECARLYKKRKRALKAQETLRLAGGEQAALEGSE